MMLLQKSWMSESTSRHNITGQLVTNIWSAETVPKESAQNDEVKYLSKYPPNTDKFSTWSSILFLDSTNPLRNIFIRKPCMLYLPRLIVKSRVRWSVISILSMLPNRILCIIQLIHFTTPVFSTYSSKIVQTKNGVTCIREGIHDEQAVGEESPHIREVEKDVPVGLVGLWMYSVCLNIGDCGKASSRVSVMSESF